jgi:4-hydroxybenzoate polyprenyltransferase
MGDQPNGSLVSTARDILVTTRPRQWTKNLVVLAALAFSGDLFDAQRALLAVATFGLFCLLSGAVYTFNDIVDAQADKTHAEKAARPIASGSLSVGVAVPAALVLAVLAVAGCFALGVRVGVVALAYLALQAGYTLLFKRVVILDAMVIASGFVLRAVAGAWAIKVPVSPWLLLCTFLLAVFLALAKRRHELGLLEEQASSHRESLREYSVPLIDSMISATVAATILAYALYTFSPGRGERYHYLMATVPIVAYGLYRYLFLVYGHNLGGSPEEILLTDWPLIIDIIVWMAAVGIIVYVLPS